MLPSDEELLSIPGVIAVEHFALCDLPRFWCDGAAHVLSRPGVDPETYPRCDEVLVPTMEVDPSDIEAVMSGVLSRTRGEFGVTLVVRDGTSHLELGFVAARGLQRYVSIPPRSFAEAMVGGPRQVSPFAEEASTCPS